MPQRPQQLLRAAARCGHRCFYVEPAGSAAQGEAVEPEIRVFGDFAQAQAAAGGPYLLYFANLAIVGDLTRVRNGTVLFDAVDDFPTAEGQLLQAARAADVVTCTSAGVMAVLRHVRPDARVIPNACEFDHWAAEPARTPAELRLLPEPRAVFIGAVAQWVDVGLVADCARALPAASFVLVGPHLQDMLDRGRAMPDNLWALGLREYRDLPAYAHAAGVLLLPFREDLREARAANPVKLWEYLATGRPVVATNVPEVARLAPLVTVGSGRAFVEAVADALRRPPDPAGAAARREVAARNTWDGRWREIEDLLSTARRPAQAMAHV